MFDVPDENTLYPYSINKFLGVDFTSDPIQVSTQRSPDSTNISNEDDFNQKRFGYDEILELIDEPNINGIWNVDSLTSNLIIIHAGTKLYETTIPLPTTSPFYTQIYDGLADVITQKQGIVIDGKLFIFDGVEPIVYYFDGSDFTVDKLVDIGTIPTTSISRTPDGTTSTSYDKPNRINNKRSNHFLGDETSTEYILDSLPDATLITIGIMQSDGTFTYNTEGVGTPGFTVDRTGEFGIITFTTAPGETHLYQEDNVYVNFSVDLSEYSDLIKGCNILGTFGYDGNINRLFLSGNSDYPNIDWYSEQADPLYFPEDNWKKIGLETSPIMSYSNSGSRLMVNKKFTDTDSTIYYRDSALLSGTEVFPVSSGQKTIGTITKNCNDNVVDEPVILSDLGLYSLLYVDDTNEDNDFAQLRSYYVNGRLLKEDNLENAISIMVKDKYYLAINNHVYVLDTRYKSYEDDSSTRGFQYEWYYWTDVPVRCWFQLDNELYFGTSDGKICKFNSNNTNVDCYWETPWLDFNNLIKYKNVLRTNVICGNKKNEHIKVGYKIKNTDKIIIDKTFNDTSDSIFPRNLMSKKKAKKFMYVKFYFKNETDSPMSFHEMSLTYTKTSKYRGD